MHEKLEKLKHDLYVGESRERTAFVRTYISHPLTTDYSEEEVARFARRPFSRHRKPHAEAEVARGA